MNIINNTKERLRSLFFIFGTFLLLPFFYLGIFFNRIKNQKKPLRILVIQRGKIGDLICTTGVFRAIKEKYPDSYLAVLTLIYTSDIIANNPYIDQIIQFDEKRSDIGYLMGVIRKTRKEKFCFSINSQPNAINSILSFWSMIPCRVSTVSHCASVSAKILSIFDSYNLEFKDNDMTFEHYAKLLKFLDINISSVGADLFINGEAEHKTRNFLKEKGLFVNDFLVGIFPTAGNKLKEWETEKWIALSNLLIDNLAAKIILAGGPNDYSVLSKILAGTKNRAIDSSGTFALGEIPAFFKKLKICITSFSGPMHIADGVGVPIIAIAGPCNFHNQPPIGEKTKIIYHPIYCHPCVSFTKTAIFCKEGHHRCIKETTVDEVYQAVLDLKNKFKL